MYVRLAGCDAEVEFHPILTDVVTRMEERFPWPEFAVMFADSQQEEAPDLVILARRYGGVLVPMVYLTIEEIDQLEAQEADWMAEVASDLARTEEEVQELIETEKAAAEAEKAEAEAANTDETAEATRPAPDNGEAAKADRGDQRAAGPAFGAEKPVEADLGPHEEPEFGGSPSGDFSDSIVAMLRDLDIPDPEELKAALAAEREAEESGEAEAPDAETLEAEASDAEASDADETETETADDPEDQD